MAMACRIVERSPETDAAGAVNVAHALPEDLAELGHVARAGRLKQLLVEHQNVGVGVEGGEPRAELGESDDVGARDGLAGERTRGLFADPPEQRGRLVPVPVDETEGGVDDWCHGDGTGRLVERECRDSPERPAVQRRQLGAVPPPCPTN